MRMPIGVPVVRPSTTPERMRTWSASRRWLTKCDVPLRRRSTSCCRSASLSSSPGGQPSTMHPIAGPWLSPNVVTVNSLPMVLPDMIVRCASGRCYVPSARRQLLAPEQEHSAATALEYKPHEGQSAKCPSHRALGVPHLDDQHPARPQMPAGFPQDDAYGIEPRAAGRERDAPGAPPLDGQPPARPQVPAGSPRDDAYGIEPRAAGRERDARLVPVLR